VEQGSNVNMLSPASPTWISGVARPCPGGLLARRSSGSSQSRRSSGGGPERVAAGDTASLGVSPRPRPPLPPPRPRLAAAGEVAGAAAGAGGVGAGAACAVAHSRAPAMPNSCAAACAVAGCWSNRLLTRGAQAGSTCSTAACHLWSTQHSRQQGHGYSALLVQGTVSLLKGSHTVVYAVAVSVCSCRRLCCCFHTCCCCRCKCMVLAGHSTTMALHVTWSTLTEQQGHWR
jgi:hypothetical protein